MSKSEAENNSSAAKPDWRLEIEGYAWYQQMQSPEFLESPNYLEGRVLRGPDLKIELGELLAFIEESLSYEEITDYASGKGYDIIGHFYDGYAQQKYGNHGRFFRLSMLAIHNLSTGIWSGFEDNAFQDYLRNLVQRGYLKDWEKDG